MTPNNSPAGEVRLDAKGCPFCGGAANINSASNVVECNDCGCTLYLGDIDYSDSEKVEAWNRRATPSIDGAGVRVKALREAETAVEAVLEDRARYFDRTTGHFDRADAARSYRVTKRDVLAAIRALTPTPEPTTVPLDTSGPTEAEPTPVAGWLLEGGDGYWTGHDLWNLSKDHSDACRFARRDDAERVRCWLIQNSGQAGRVLASALRATEHVWMER